MEVQWLRYLSEMKQTGSMAIFLGTMAILPVFVGISASTTIGQDWGGSDLIFPPIAMLLANLTQAIYGITNIAVGMGWLLLEKGNQTCSLLNMIITYLSWYPYITMIAAFIFMADNYPEAGQPFIPMSYALSKNKVNSVATLETLGFIAYAANLIGGLTFCAVKLYRMQSDKGLTVYNQSYYKSRQVYYSALTLLAGIVQLALGYYALDKFGVGRLDQPIGEGPFLVSYPEISIVMGSIVFFHGLMLLLRTRCSQMYRMLTGKYFDRWTFFVFLAAASMQILSQVAVAPGYTAPKAIGIFDVLALAVFPTYLDIKVRFTPEKIEEDFYSRKSTPEGIGEEFHPKKSTSEKIEEEIYPKKSTPEKVKKDIDSKKSHGRDEEVMLAQ